jgi:hypothetical protein
MLPVVSCYCLRSLVDVEPSARRLVRGEAWLSPAVNGWSSLYDAYLDRPDVEEMHRVASAASRELECVVFALFATPEQLVYVLYDGGLLQDAYAAKPEALSVADRTQYAGQADAVLRYCLEGTSREALEAVLHGGSIPGSGMTNEHFDTIRKKVQERLPADLGNPDVVQKMLVQAAEQMKMMPPGMVETFLRSLGVPPNHPALQAMQANPAEFIQRMAADGDAVRRFSEQIAAGFNADMPSLALGPMEKAALLSRAMGLPDSQAMTSYGQVANVRPSGFRKLGTRA